MNMAEMEKGQSGPENSLRKSNKEDNPHGTTYRSFSTMEAGPSNYHGLVSRNSIVERSGPSNYHGLVSRNSIVERSGPSNNHGLVSRNSIVERSGRQRPRPQSSDPYHLKDSRQRPRPQSSDPYHLKDSRQRRPPQSSVSVERNLQFSENSVYGLVSRYAIIPRAGIDDLEVTGVTKGPRGKAIKAVCPPTAPVGGAPPPRLDPI